MWEYSDGEFVKLFRKMVRWEWYTDVNTKVLFIHCLLKANWKAGRWKGHKYERGQFITSLPSLADETGLTIQEVRTALNHLKATGELTVKRYPKFSVITVVSYGSYQDKQQANQQSTNSQLTVNQQSTNSQSTTDIRTYKNNKEVKEEKKEPAAPFSPLLDEDPDPTDEELRAQGWTI